MQLKWFGIAMLGLLVACGSDDKDEKTGSSGSSGNDDDDDKNGSSGGGGGGGGSSGTTVTEKFSCRINGTCYKCSSAADLADCENACSQTSTSYCDSN